jgi:mobilization protein NikA
VKIEMEQEKKKVIRYKGGRPVKAIKRDNPLTVKCTTIERAVIAGKAKKVNQPISEYLRTLGLSGNPVMLVKTVPKEVLALCGALNHIGALLNQIAKKRNSNDELNAFERADLKVLEGRVKDILETIKINIK